MQNIVILAGNIGQKPEVRSTQSGTKITNFTLATSRPRLSEGRVMRDENGYRVMDTEWHRITCFNGLGKTVAEHCEKGMKVLVHGRIHYTKWTDATGKREGGTIQQPARVGIIHAGSLLVQPGDHLACGILIAALVLGDFHRVACIGFSVFGTCVNGEAKLIPLCPPCPWCGRCLPFGRGSPEIC